MHEGAGRIAGGLILLVALWIGVYWWWPHESKITFAQADEAVRGLAPSRLNQAPPAAPSPASGAAEPATPTPSQAGPADPPQVIIPPQFTEYTVKDGDTFRSIAKHYYGSESLASVIVAANPLMSPDRLNIGRVIRIPKDPNNIQGIPIRPGDPPAPASTPAPAEGSGRTYIVQSGDSLSKIAQEVYGDSRLASLIFEANRDQLPTEHTLKIGQKLKVPPRPQR